MLTLVLHPGWRHRPPPVRPADGRIDPDGYSGSKDFMQISLHSLAVAGTGLPPVRQRSGLSAKRQDATGAGSDVVYNTNGEAGRLVDNQVNGRAISVDLAQLRPPRAGADFGRQGKDPRHAWRDQCAAADGADYR